MKGDDGEENAGYTMHYISIIYTKAGKLVLAVMIDSFPSINRKRKMPVPLYQTGTWASGKCTLYLPSYILYNYSRREFLFRSLIIVNYMFKIELIESFLKPYSIVL